MANEIQISTSLSVVKNNLVHRPAAEVFRATLTGTGGPYIGVVNVPTTGLNVSLASLGGSLGVGRIKNQDSTNRVGYGLYDSDSGKFFEIHEILPGECYPFRLSRNLASEFVGLGTGTTTSNNVLRLLAYGDTVKVLLEVFPM